MKINVSSISRSIDSSMKVQGEVNVSQISYHSEYITIKSPIKVDATITNMGEYLLVKGFVNADLILNCSRCLENFDYGLTAPFEEEISNKKDDGDFIYFEGDVVDLTDIVVNNILLSLPMKFVCSENCKGLCPKCGENININKCNCEEESCDPRLAVLKDLLKGN